MHKNNMLYCNLLNRVPSFQLLYTLDPEFLRIRVKVATDMYGWLLLGKSAAYIIIHNIMCTM